MNSSSASNDREADGPEEAGGERRGGELLRGQNEERPEEEGDETDCEEEYLAIALLLYDPQDGFAELDESAQLKWLVQHVRKNFGSQLFKKDSPMSNDDIDAYLALLIRDIIVEPLRDVAPPETSKNNILSYINKRVAKGRSGSEFRDLARQIQESTNGHHYENVPNGETIRTKSWFYKKTIKKILQEALVEKTDDEILKWYLELIERKRGNWDVSGT